MAMGTRGVLAIFAGVAMTLGFVAAYTENRLLGTWLMMIGFVFATLWSVMSIFWARSHPSALPPNLWMSMAAMAGTAVVYFGYLGMYGDGLGE